MLYVTVRKDKIGIRFRHSIHKPHEIEGLTGRVVDDDRRCTIVQIEVNGKHKSQGIAVCHPDDNFRRSTGRKRALIDALYYLDKEIRIAVWKRYGEEYGF